MMASACAAAGGDVRRHAERHGEVGCVDGQLERTRRKVVPKPHAAGDRRDQFGAVPGIDERQHACGGLRHGGRGIASQSRPGLAPAGRDSRTGGGRAHRPEAAGGGRRFQRPAQAGRGRSGARLLHLDLHPRNILVSDSAEVTGVLDWANAAVGDPVLDRARSRTILNLDPAARARRAEPGWQALTEGWTDSGALYTIPAAARAWACRFMLTDLARRYPPSDLAHVRCALCQAEAATGQ